MKRVAVVTKKKNDILTILERTSGIQVEQLAPEGLGSCALADFDAFVLLGGTEEAPCCLNGVDRFAMEKEIPK